MLTFVILLGRVSLAVRELPDADQESGVMLLDSLQETVNMQNAQQAHRSSIVDILSLDLTRTLNLPATNCSSENILQKSESGSSLKDFEMEVYGNKMQQETASNNDFAKPAATHRNSIGERGAKRKLPDFNSEDAYPQFRAGALSNSVGNIEGSNQFGNDQPESSNSRHAKANSVPLSVGAIPKNMNYHKSIEDMVSNIFFLCFCPNYMMYFHGCKTSGPGLISVLKEFLTDCHFYFIYLSNNYFTVKNF